MAEAPPAPEGLAVTLTTYGFNVQARAAIIAMGIDNVDELVDISSKGLKELFMMSNARGTNGDSDDEANNESSKTTNARPHLFQEALLMHLAPVVMTPEGRRWKPKGVGLQVREDVLLTLEPGG